MENKTANKLSDENLEKVTGGMIIDNTDWIDLYMSKYRPRLISGLNDVDYESERPILEWCIQELVDTPTTKAVGFLFQ